MYVVGGNDRFSEVLRSVERYSFDDNEWSVVSPMMVNRASPGSYFIVYEKLQSITKIVYSCGISRWIIIRCRR